MAAIKNVRFKILSSAGANVYIKFPNPLYFGLPIKRLNGTVYTYEEAQRIAADAVSVAERAVKRSYDMGVYSSDQLSKIFYEALQASMAASAGTVTKVPGAISIADKDITEANYDLFLGLGCL